MGFYLREVAVNTMVGGIWTRDISGLLYQMPVLVQAIIAVVALIVVVGLLGRVKAILRGHGTATDYLGLLIILVLVTLFLIMAVSGVVKTLHVY